ncbi:diacylglycerol kinase (ATP) [Devosia sp. UYZn731]|uniref:diacylglycerol/lipid kinase family protein n=1 Tax=Devosia sp. UYZn731 TaxID=3156345 RepID=UPI0033949494
MIVAARTRLLVIHNARAGGGARRRYLICIALLKEAGAAVDIVETRSADEGTTAAASAASTKRFDAVIAAGGDGTVHAVALGLIGSSTPLGIIPTGTADVYARELGVPRFPSDLVHLILHGTERAMPVGEVNGRPFLFVVGVGLDADAVRLFEERGARRLGRLGLVWPALTALMNANGAVRVKTERSDGEVKWVIVTRARRYAAGLMLAPKADLGRSEFHVLSMTGSLVARIGQLSALAIGQARNAPGATLKSADWVLIEGDGNTAVQVDGDVAGPLPLCIRTHDKSLRIILPYGDLGGP